MTERQGWVILLSLLGATIVGAVAFMIYLVQTQGVEQLMPTAVRQMAQPAYRGMNVGVNPTTLVMREAPDPADPHDVRDIAQAMNGPAAPAFNTQFHPGQASPGAARPAVTTRADGVIAVQMPSRSPLATPVVDDGRVFVSAGFSSTAFHALDAATGQPLWSAGLSDNGPSAAAVDDGVCVLNTESCTVFALDARSGKARWAHYLGDPQMSRPAIGGGLAFTSYPAPGGLAVNFSHDIAQDDQRMVGTHVVAAFDLHSGALRWQRWIDGDIMTEPVYHDGALHLATFSGTLYRFDAQSGDILAARANRATSAPTIHQGQIVYTVRADDAADGDAVAEAVVADDLATGRRVQRFAAAAAPQIDADVQRHTGYFKTGRQLDAGNGFGDGAPPASNAELALANIGLNSVSALQAFEGSRPAAAGDRLYATRGDRVECLDTQSGQTLWTFPLEGDLESAGGSLGTPPLLVNGQVLVATLSGKLLLLDADTGRLDTSYDLHAPVRSRPAATATHAYVPTETGQLLIVAMER